MINFVVKIARLIYVNMSNIVLVMVIVHITKHEMTQRTDSEWLNTRYNNLQYRLDTAFKTIEQ